MKRLVLAALLCGSTAFLRADFTYQETSQMTGGSMAAMLKSLGPLARAAREPIVSTHIVKGNRMATVTKDRVSVIDIDQETITTVDNARKTYSVMTFAQMKQAMDDAAQRLQSHRNSDKGDAQAQFKISAKSTGQTRNVQGLNAKEMLITMAMESSSAKTGDSGAMEISTDAWYAPVPGYGEVKEFHKRMAMKLGSMFGSGMQQLTQMAAAQGGQANMQQGMEQVAKELSKIDGVPVESVVKMGASGASAAQAPSQSSASSANSGSSDSGGTSGSSLAALGRLGGFGRHKKDDSDSASSQSGAPADSGGTLMEMTTTLTSFTSAPADLSKFDVPAGYKQVEPALRRAAR